MTPRRAPAGAAERRPPARPVGRGGERDGAALVVVVLLTLAMFALAHGLLVSAESAYLTSRAYARLVELDAHSAGSIEDELRRGWVPWMDSVAVGAGRSWSRSDPGEPRVVVAWRRLDREAWIVGARSSRGDGPPVGSRRLAWIYDPLTRVAELPAVVSTAAGAPVVVYGAIVPEAAPALGVVDSPALGLLDVTRLLEAADSVGPAGTPTPVESAGVCVTSARWNWGDPERPYGPCGTFYVVRARAGALTVRGGSGQGVFVVDGDLVLRDGAALHGLVVASGRVDVVEGSRIEGRVIAYGGIVVGIDAAVVGSANRAERSLAATRTTLGAAVLLHGAARLGPG